MPDVLIELLKQAPSLTVLYLLVKSFLQHQESEGTLNRACLERMAEAIADLKVTFLESRK